MDVWVEFKNASRWQAEALFRNFFPCEDDDENIEEQDLGQLKLDDNIQVHELAPANEHQSKSSFSRVYKPVDPLDMPKKHDEGNPSSPSSSSSTPPTLWSLATSAPSLLNRTIWPSTTSSAEPPSPPPLPKTHSGSPIPISPSSPSASESTCKLDKSQFGATNTAYLPPPPDASITAKSKTKPLDRKTLAALAKEFADGVPEEEFSVAGLQGCECKKKKKKKCFGIFC